MPTTRADVRAAIGCTLTGRVLEVGPGNQPFPTPAADEVVYADRRVPGGRDRTWPELAGQPSGPPADLDVDLDVDRLSPVADGSFDAVVASHIIEHLADPLGALAEMHRVLRPGGRLVLVVPDRAHTFDAGRAPTPLAHLLDEHRRGVTQVDDDHIREFCTAIFEGPVIHPDEVRAWHDPDRLDAEMLALHRRRTIHAHCWSPEEFVTMVAGAVATGEPPWALADVYVRDDLDEPGDEFGLVLVRIAPGAPEAAGQHARDLLAAWADGVLAEPRRDPGRLVLLDRAVRRDLGGILDGVDVAVSALAGCVARLRAEAAAVAQDLAAAQAAQAQAEGDLARLQASTTYVAARVVATPLRALSRRSARHHGP